MQALLSGQSLSYWHSPLWTRIANGALQIGLCSISLSNLLGTQRLYGSPVKPGGHLQTALWLLTVHSAVELQGLSTAQGLTQALFLQAWVNGHSSSDEQPTSMGAATKGKQMVNLCLLHPNHLSWLTDFVTSDYAIASVAFKAYTAHCSSWCGRVDFASCIGHTRSYGCARIYTSVSASLLVTDLKGRTININSTVLFFYNWFRN